MSITECIHIMRKYGTQQAHILFIFVHVQHKFNLSLTSSQSQSKTFGPVVPQTWSLPLHPSPPRRLAQHSPPEEIIKPLGTTSPQQPSKHQVTSYCSARSGMWSTSTRASSTRPFVAVTHSSSTGANSLHGPHHLNKSKGKMSTQVCSWGQVLRAHYITLYTLYETA